MQRLYDIQSQSAVSVSNKNKALKNKVLVWDSLCWQNLFKSHYFITEQFVVYHLEFQMQLLYFLMRIWKVLFGHNQRSCIYKIFSFYL